MSPEDGTCEYVLDPDNPETWGGEEGDECYVNEEVLNEDDVWTCPHETEDGEDLCIFHLPLAEKDDEKVVNAFLNALEMSVDSDGSATRKLQFLGMRVGTFDLTDITVDIELKEAEIDLSYADISVTLDWSSSVFDIGQLHLTGIRCEDDAVFEGTIFKGPVGFKDAEFGGVALILARIVVDGEGFEPGLCCFERDMAKTICER